MSMSVGFTMNSGGTLFSALKPEESGQTGSGRFKSSVLSTNSLAAGSYLADGALGVNDGSTYKQARMASAQAQASMQARQMAVLTQGIAAVEALGDDASYAMRNLEGQKAARNMETEKQQSVAEESEKNLDEIKDSVEEKAEEAIAAENGAETTGKEATGTEAANSNREASTDEDADLRVPTVEELAEDAAATKLDVAPKEPSPAADEAVLHDAFAAASSTIPTGIDRAAASGFAAYQASVATAQSLHLVV